MRPFCSTLFVCCDFPYFYCNLLWLRRLRSPRVCPVGCQFYELYVRGVDYLADFFSYWSSILYQVFWVPFDSLMLAVRTLYHLCSIKCEWTLS